MKTLCLTQQLAHGNYNLHSFPVPKPKLKQVKKNQRFFRSTSAQATQKLPSPARKLSDRQGEKERGNLLWEIDVCSIS